MICFQHVYRASFLSENMIYDIVRTLKIEHVELVKNAASAVFQVGSRLFLYDTGTRSGIFLDLAFRVQCTACKQGIYHAIVVQSIWRF